jgi:hypothetical protein
MLPPSVEPVAELPEPVVVAEADPLPVPINDVVRVQEHDVSKCEERIITGVAETIPDAPVVVRGVSVPETIAEVDEAIATDAMR